MPGFALALAGGALKGWGEGQLSDIKAQREAKLQQLEAERAERAEGRRMTFEIDACLRGAGVPRKTGWRAACRDRETDGGGNWLAGETGRTGGQN